MQRIYLICVGKLKEKFYLDAAAEYVKRLGTLCDFTLTELPEERLGDNPFPADISRALAREADAIRAKIPKDATVIALCIEGQTLSSQGLADVLGDLALHAQGTVAFIIGGSFGLDETLKRQAQRRLSMSPMTFPHHMARIMLLEQIYRAYQIQRGTKYHK